MKHGSNKNLIIVLSVVLAVLCVGTTFAWLAGNKEIECDDMQGSIITQYFHCGTGTEDDPFVITRPIHYYNLIYLYQRKEGFADENYHFQLGYDIGGNNDGVLDEGEEWLFYSYDDEGNIIPGEYTTELNMAGYSDGVLPIGTSATPFNAIFEGNSLTVKNLKVISSQTINKVDYNTCDIGLFGYIGPNAEISDVYYKNVTIDLTGLDPTTVNHEELHNDDIHEGEVSYVGVIAGHIVDSAICDRVYINDCTILGGAAAKCEFGYFGVVENAETGAPSPQLVESIKELRGAGSNAGFGGSIDMQMLYNRLTAIHRKSYANNYTYRYLTAKNKYVDEVTGDIHYDDFVYDGTLVARNYQAGEGYYSPSEGNFVFGSNNSSSGSGNNRTWPYHYISGINTSSTKYPVTTTVYTTKEDPDNPGKYLSDYGFKFGYNGYWLTLDENGNFVSAENEADAAVFVPEGDGYLYTRYDGEIRYLVPDGNSGIKLSTTPSLWYASDTDEVYITIGGLDYYLWCDTDGNWTITRKDALTISDDYGNYIYVRAGNVNNTEDDAQATRWFSASGDLSSTGFFYPQNGTNYYLGVDNGDLTVKTTNTVWTADENGYYTTVGGEKFYLVCEGGDWKAVTLSETRIYDANGNYLSASATPAVTNAYSDEDATPWIIASNGSSVTIAAVINGTKYYLGNNNGTLTLTTTPTNWVKNGNSYYTTVGDIDYYLTYSDGAWRTVPLAYQIITDNNGRYLRVTGNNAINNGTQANATHFYFENPGENPSGKAYCIVNGTTYYLRNNNGTLQTTTNAANAASWVNNGSSLTVDSADGNYTYALRYNNGWTIQTFKNGKYVTDGKGDYLQLTGTGTTAFTNTTDVDNATVFTFDADGRIHATVNNTEVYLRNNNGNFRLYTGNTAGSRTMWTIGSDSIGNGGNYLICDSGTWKLSTSTTKPAYRISYTTGGTTYYMGANGTTLTAVTDANDALLFDGTSGNMSTTINGNTYYLNITTADPPVLSLSETATDFTSSNNRLYVSARSGWTTIYYYSVTFDTDNHTWSGTRSQSNTSGTQLTFTEDRNNPILMNTYGQDYAPALPTVVVNDVLLPTPVVYSEVTEREVPEIYVEEDPIEASLTWSDGELLVVEKTAGPNSYTGTYFPLRTELHDVEEGETYSGSDPYGVSPENTGYIIGGNYETSERHADIRVSRYSTNDISNSYTNGNLTTVYTNDADGRRTLTAVEMQDEYYVTARDQFLESIDGTNIYGLHFMNSEISMNHLIEAENVMILHKTYRNYQFPEDCIDFRTVEPGFISFFGGTYFTNNNAFFSLHEIFRNEDKTISAIYEIKLVCAKFKQVPLIGNVMDTDSKYLNIYHDPVTNTTFYIDASGNHVPYTDGMTLPDNYQIVFDTDWITDPSDIREDAVYYFHIPCNIGEFALGSVKGKTGAYLMYLDIGTNGGDIYQTIVSTAGNAVTDKFNVDVRDAEDNKADYAILQIATDVPECASDDYSIKISFDESNKGPDNVHFKGLYTIEVVNNTGEELTLYALLCDDDDDLYDDYGYAYELIYTNGDHTETVYANEITALEYWQMAAGFVIPASGAVTEVDYMALAD